MYAYIHSSCTHKPRLIHNTHTHMQFVDMLSSMVSSVEDPHLLHKKLVDLAPMHVKKGVKAAHMPYMFQVLDKVLNKVLGDGFLPKYKEAWIWVWDFLTVSMTDSLSEASASGQVRGACCCVDNLVCRARCCVYDLICCIWCCVYNLVYRVW